MAEALLRHHLEAADFTVPVSSAGTIGWNSSGPTDHTLTALAERGVVLEGHVSRRINADLIAPAWLVLAMTNDHADAVSNHFPDAAPRTFVLGQLIRLGERVGPAESVRCRSGSPPWTSCAIRGAGGRSPRTRSATRSANRSRRTRSWPLRLDDLTGRLAALIAGSGSGTGLTEPAAIGQDGS